MCDLSIPLYMCVVDEEPSASHSAPGRTGAWGKGAGSTEKASAAWSSRDTHAASGAGTGGKDSDSGWGARAGGHTKKRSVYYILHDLIPILFYCLW